MPVPDTLLVEGVSASAAAPARCPWRIFLDVPRPVRERRWVDRDGAARSRNGCAGWTPRTGSSPRTRRRPAPAAAGCAGLRRRCRSSTGRVAVGLGMPDDNRSSSTATRRRPHARSSGVHHGDIFVDDYEWLRDKTDPEVIDYLRGRERLHRGPHRRAGAAAAADLRRDRRPHQADRPVGAVPARRLLVLQPHRRGPAVPDPLPGAGHRRRPAEHRRGPSQRSGRRAGAAGRQRGRRRLRVLRPRHHRASPGRHPAGLLGRPDRRRAVHPAASRTSAPARTCPTRSPDVFYSSAWSADASAIFYITVDDAWRPYQVWRHLVGTDAAERRGRSSPRTTSGSGSASS